MFELIIDQRDLYDEESEKFTSIPRQKLQLEHSLLSISKWEERHYKPFLKNEQRSSEEILDYIRCMTINRGIDPMVYYTLTQEQMSEISKYINEEMTATWFPDEQSKKSREVITNEVIYYWMITLQIPLEFEKRHLNKLLTLIRVITAKNAPQKKMSKNEIRSRNKLLNEQRKKLYNTMG